MHVHARGRAGLPGRHHGLDHAAVDRKAAGERAELLPALVGARPLGPGAGLEEGSLVEDEVAGHAREAARSQLAREVREAPFDGAAPVRGDHGVAARPHDEVSSQDAALELADGLDRRHELRVGAEQHERGRGRDELHVRGRTLRRVGTDLDDVLAARDVSHEHRDVDRGPRHDALRALLGLRRAPRDDVRDAGREPRAQRGSEGFSRAGRAGRRRRSLARGRCLDLARAGEGRARVAARAREDEEETQRP
jgi:hypothetical protein